MYLRSISYSEFKGQPNYWSVQKMQFGTVNLIVGKNSSGKSRVINIITALAQAVSGKNAQFNDGVWSAEFDRFKGLQKENQKFKLIFEGGGVAHESFKVKSDVLMERGATGEGFVTNRKGSRVKYSVAREKLMSVMRSDPYQHPQFQQLQAWASNLCVYRFGSDFGKGNFSMQNHMSPGAAVDKLDLSVSADNPTNVFLQTKEKFGEDFISLMLRDLDAVGYPCLYIGLEPVIQIGGMVPLGLAIKEKGLDCYTRQNDMSQGLYRALALLVQFNANILWAQSYKVGRELLPGDAPMIIIDDIGEGLDYDRSKRLINLLVTKALEFNVQLIMSSNDRFIMNDVPLEYWTVLNREGPEVKPFNYSNSKNLFDDFEYLGLNNFDFFANEYFKSSAQG